MSQVSWRTDEWLVERVKFAALRSGRSMNEFMTFVLDAATDPDQVTDEMQRVRERLQHAGLLAPDKPQRIRRPPPEVVGEAGRAAATGRPVADLVSEGR